MLTVLLLVSVAVKLLLALSTNRLRWDSVLLTALLHDARHPKSVRRGEETSSESEYRVDNHM